MFELFHALLLMHAARPMRIAIHYVDTNHPTCMGLFLPTKGLGDAYGN